MQDLGKRPLRLAIIARRFWPRVGSLETRAAQLACGLADIGLTVTVVTARWQRPWPARIDYHGVPVVRLDPPPRGRWSRWNWSRSLAAWLRQHAGEFDLVYAWGLMHEAATAIHSLAGRLPVVLVPERIGWHGDCFRQVHEPGGRGIKSACLRASALVAAIPAARTELEAAGYPRERIVDIPLGARQSPPKSFESQSEARALLAESNPALQLALDAPLVVSTGRLDAGRGWEQLLDAWQIIARKKPAARLWLAGEGNAAASIAARIKSQGLAGRVGMIGMFDDVDCLLAAADVHAAPATDGSPQAIVEAMAAGAPSVAIDVPVNRWLLGDEAAGLLVPPHNPEALAAAILRLLNDPELADQQGTVGWQRAQVEFNLDKMVTAYGDLFQQLRALGAK